MMKVLQVLPFLPLLLLHLLLSLLSIVAVVIWMQWVHSLTPKGSTLTESFSLLPGSRCCWACRSSPGTLSSLLLCTRPWYDFSPLSKVFGRCCAGSIQPRSQSDRQWRALLLVSRLFVGLISYLIQIFLIFFQMLNCTLILLPYPIYQGLAGLLPWRPISRVLVSLTRSPTFNTVWWGLLAGFFLSCSFTIFSKLKRLVSRRSSTCVGNSTRPLQTCLPLLLPLPFLLIQLVKILLVPLPVATLWGWVLIPRLCLMSPRRCPLPITDSIPRLLLFSCSRSRIFSCVGLFH